jgi:hypothetical protein
MKAYKGVDVYIHVSLTSVLIGAGQLHAPTALTPGERASGTHWIGGCVGAWTGLDVKSTKMLPVPELELCPLGRPDSSQSLYRLRYPGFFIYI